LSRFDDKMAVVDLLTPRSGFYKVILISLFFSVDLVFHFVSCFARRRVISYFFPSVTMDAVKNLFISKALVRSIGLAVAAAAAATTAAVVTAATAAVDGFGSPGSSGSSGSLQSRFKAQTARLRDIQRVQRPKNIQRAYRPRQKK
jgi:hypothetical protein